MSPITTHVLDTSKGRPAQGVTVLLEKAAQGGSWERLAGGSTNADGRIAELLPKDSTLAKGLYRMTFGTGAYFKAQGTQGFYPSVIVVFELTEPAAHYHIPLLLSPFGYSTYRGS